jgi:hypothetical protein
MRIYITAFILVITLGLSSCGGSNDVASSGASAVSAATSATTPDVTPNTTATTPAVSTPTKPKINGQIDERTGVASVGAKMTIGTRLKLGSGSGFCPAGSGNTSGNTCAECSYGAPDCGSCFISTSNQFITTYCYQCSACDAGVNGCIQGTYGCNSCSIATGYVDGYWCQNDGTNITNACIQSTNACS